MRELNNSRVKGEYTPPTVMRLGSSSRMTEGQVQANSDDGQTADNAFPNPTESS